MAGQGLTAAAFEGLMTPLGPFERPPRLAVGVSGGPDSLALTLLAHGWATARGGAILALTVDHGLRPESAAEAAAVHETLSALGIAHAILRWTDPPADGRNIQAVARQARHALLADRCRADGILHLLLAHHRDDQAETLLLRLGRGSGVTGLAAMAPVAETEHVRLLRPLLTVSRDDLRASLGSRAAIDDPSNRNPRHARVRLRALAPALAAEGLTAERLAATAGRLGRARAALEAAAASLLSAAVAVHPLGYATLDPGPLQAAPEEVALRALAQVLACIGGAAYTPRLDGLERALDRLGAADMTLAGCRIVHRRGHWLVCRESARAAPPVPLSAGAWDGRWRWQPLPAAAASGATVGALGEADVGAVPAAARGQVPAVVAASLPAVRQAGAVVAVPGLEPAAEAASSWAGSLSFAPRVAMTYVGPGGLRRVRCHLHKQV